VGVGVGVQVLERIKDDLHKVQFAAQNEIETLAKQGAAAGRVRRKTRARGLYMYMYICMHMYM